MVEIQIGSNSSWRTEPTLLLNWNFNLILQLAQLPPPKLRHGLWLNLKYSLDHFGHPSRNFYSGEGVKVSNIWPRFSTTVDYEALWFRNEIKSKTHVGAPILAYALPKFGTGCSEL